MLKVKFKPKFKRKIQISFANDFKEFTVQQFIECMVINDEMQKVNTDLEAAEKTFDEMQADNPMDILLVEADVLALRSNLMKLECKMLAALTKAPEKVYVFLLNTPGVTYISVKKIWLKIEDNLARFNDWFEKLKPLNKFKFSDYKKHNFFKLTKVITFEVFDMTQTTVLRDSAASRIASQIDDVRTEFSKDRWSNLPKFLAFVCRPSFQEKEFSAYSPDFKKSFFGNKNASHISAEDQLTAYNEKIGIVTDERTEIFKRLPLPIALGIYKQYFFSNPQ
jgi:hypothetical protein